MSNLGKRAAPTRSLLFIGLAAACAACLATGRAFAEEPTLAPSPTGPGGPSVPVAQGVQGVQVVKDTSGFRLQVDGRDFLIKGINWVYTPAGDNYSYDLWSQTDRFIIRVLDDQMGLLRAMGVNAIRQNPDIPPR